MKPTIGLLACSIALAGCSNMNQTQQRALSGTAIGAGGGAILGACRPWGGCRCGGWPCRRPDL